MLDFVLLSWEFRCSETYTYLGCLADSGNQAGLWHYGAVLVVVFVHSTLIRGLVHDLSFVVVMQFGTTSELSINSFDLIQLLKIINP